MADPATPVATVRGDDPSALTTQQALREDMHLRELQEARLNGEIASIAARLDAMDKAIVLLQAYPTEVDRKVGQLKELTEEKFSSVANLFAEKEKAVAFAFQAAKEVVGKSEVAFTKQIDQILELVRTNTKATDDKIDNITDRINRDEGRKDGMGQSWGLLVSVVVVVTTLIGTAIVLIGTN